MLTAMTGLRLLVRVAIALLGALLAYWLLLNVVLALFTEPVVQPT